MSNAGSEKIAQARLALLKEHLERTYGRGTFYSRSWLLKQLARSTGSAEVATTVVSQSADSLERIRADLGDCTRCKLSQGRTHLVFGEGNPQADLMFVGEGPGEQEDKQGRPFVGKAGQLLDKIIEAMGLKRSDVYIANVVKCRPPGNRAPEPDEVATCEPFLFRQFDVIKPKVVVALGGTALNCLLHADAKISKLRGQFLDYRGAKLMPTFHPAFLLRNPDSKREVWEDMKKVMLELGIK